MPINQNLLFLKKATPRKLYNASQIFGSYYRSRLTKSASIAGMPMSLAIEPTTHCNLRCPECPSGLRSFTRPTGSLQEEIFKKAIDELHPYLLNLTFYFQGEPYLNPKFLEMVEYASRRNIYTSTSTNAHFLNMDNAEATVRSGLDQLIVSIDGTSQETYQQYRVGGKLDKVLEGARNVIEWKRKLKSATPHVIFQFLVVKPNEHQIEDVKALGKVIGVDEVKFKTAQIYDFKNGSPLIPTIDKYSRYRKNSDGTYSLKNKLLNQCWKMWHSSVITWDGKVIPCCFDKDASHQFGSLQEQSFKEVWISRQYQNFRKALLHSRSSIDICQNCTEGTKVFSE